MTSPRADEHRRAATRAGLRYVTDGIAGIHRRRSGTGWIYYAPNGARIRNPHARKRLNALAIPPAWTDVWICPDPDGHIQATARDARGRKQYRYHPSYRAARDRSKFRRMLEFSEVLPLLRERVERDLRAGDLTRRQLLATVVRLLDKTLIRVGNDEYVRENRSYGLTTLRRRHVRVEGAMLRFSFRGKSGVEHSVAVTDRRLARIIQRCQDLPGQELFQYLDASEKRQTVSSDDVNAYLREISDRDITAKDFRTWGARCWPPWSSGQWDPPRAAAKRTGTSSARLMQWRNGSATPAPCAGSTTSTPRCCTPITWALPCRILPWPAAGRAAGRRPPRCGVTRSRCCSFWHHRRRFRNALHARLDESFSISRLSY